MQGLVTLLPIAHLFSDWLGRKTQKFSGTNQKSERRRPFGTGLVRHCPQGLFPPFFTFLRAIFSRPFRLSLAPTICPWVSEDVAHVTWAECKLLSHRESVSRYRRPLRRRMRNKILRSVQPCYEWSDRGHTVEPESRLKRWIHTKKHRNTSKDNLFYLFYKKKVKYNDIQYNVSTLACNATLTLFVTWAWDACVPIGSWSSELMTGRFCFVIHWRSWWWTCVHFTRWLDVECVKYKVGQFYASRLPRKTIATSRGNNKQLTIFWFRGKRADHASFTSIITYTKGRTIRKLMGVERAGEVQKKYSRKEN